MSSPLSVTTLPTPVSEGGRLPIMRAWCWRHIGVWNRGEYDKTVNLMLHID